MVDELLRCGVTDIVVAPGSRSTPLAIAIARAEQEGDVVVHVRLDERSAGYLALGLAKVTGVPAAVITTSGTAAVNLHPAIVEADLSGVPILAVTADRPPQLRGVGANQTIRQPGIYGDAVRLAVDLAPATRAVGEVAYWRSTVSRAVAASTDAVRPGPVHLNVPFADPLVPDGDDEWIEPLDGRPDGRPWTVDPRLIGGISTALDDSLDLLLDDATVPARGVVLIGDLAAFGDLADQQEMVALAGELADALGWPVIAEPSGNAAGADTVLSHGPLLLADPGFADAHVPDLVVTIGRVGLDRSALRMVARAGLHLAVDPHQEWSDPTRSADAVVTSVPLPPSLAEVDDDWLADWQRADVLAAAAVETALFARDDALTGMHVARVTAAAVPDGGLLFVGPSWSVRHVAAFAANAVRDGSILGNRGTSGIDGCVSSAWGAASAFQRAGGAGALALLGDQTFVYDIAGLLAPAEEERPDLVYVVTDNDGGGIFSSLEQGAPEHADVFERVFGVPLGLDLVALARANGIEAVAVDTAAGLATAIDDAVGAGGVRVVVARTTGRAGEVAGLESVRQAVAQALASS